MKPLLNLFLRSRVCFFLEVLGDLVHGAQAAVCTPRRWIPRLGTPAVLAWRRPRSCCAMICVSAPPRCDGHTITHWGSRAPQLTARTGRPRRMCLGRSCTRSLCPSWCSRSLFSSARRSSRPPHLAPVTRRNSRSAAQKRQSLPLS